MAVKNRTEPGVVDDLILIGDVKDSDVIIVDDICDTAGTLLKTADVLKKNGAKKIYACITHPLLSKNAIDKLQDSAFYEIIVTDTIPIQKNIPSNNIIRLLSCR